ncbi:hypothetical protein Hanom_Chr06g00562691 [Helianthus anomalus]
MVIRLCFACNLCFLLFHMLIFFCDIYVIIHSEKNDCLYKDFSTLTNNTHKRIQGRVNADTHDHMKTVSLYFN